MLPGRTGHTEVPLEDLERALGGPAARLWQVFLTLRDDCATSLVHPTSWGLARRAHVTLKQYRTGVKRLRQAGLIENLGASWARVPQRGQTVVRKVFWRRVLGHIDLRGPGYAEVPAQTLAWAADPPRHGGRRAGAGRPRKVPPKPTGLVAPPRLVALAGGVGAPLPASLNGKEPEGASAGTLILVEAAKPSENGNMNTLATLLAGAGGRPAVGAPKKSSGQGRPGNQVGTPIVPIQESREVPQMKPSGFPSENQKSAPLTRRTNGFSFSGAEDEAVTPKQDEQTQPAFPHLAATTRKRKPRQIAPLPPGFTPVDKGITPAALGGGFSAAPAGPLAPRSPDGRVLAGLELVPRPDGGRAYYAPVARDTTPREPAAKGNLLAEVLAGNELGKTRGGPVDLGMPLGEMHARGWIPPIPGTVIRTAKLPDPPVLREDEEHLWATQVAQAYRTAAEYVYGKRCWTFSQGPGRYRKLLEEGAQMLFQEGVSPLAWCVWSMQNWLGHGPARSRSVFAPAGWVFDVTRIFKQAGWHHQTNPCVGGQVVWGPRYRALVRKFGALRLRLASACLRAELDVRAVVAEYFPNGWEVEYEAAAREAAQDRETIRQAVRGGVFLWGAPKAKEGR